VGPRAGLDAGARRKICPCRGSNLDRPARSQTLYCLSYRSDLEESCTELGILGRDKCRVMVVAGKKHIASRSVARDRWKGNGSDLEKTWGMLARNRWNGDGSD
jgi:hypothetical protein